MRLIYLFSTLIIGQLLASSSLDGVDSSATLRSINSVREVTLPADMKGFIVVCDADETITQVCCMANNYEYGRQHEAVLQAQAQATFAALTDLEKVGLVREYNNWPQAKKDCLAEHYFINTGKFLCELSPEEQLIAYVVDKVESIMENAPHTYSLTEQAWPEFLQTVRVRGGKTIIVSSRKFDHHKGVSDKEEPARIAFFEALGFSKADMIYAGSASDYDKGTRVLQYTQDVARDNPEVRFSGIMFFDNLPKHCAEVIDSKALRELGCTIQAFEHNAYLDYVTKYAQVILPAQFRAAALQGRRLTDAEILNQLNESYSKQTNDSDFA